MTASTLSRKIYIGNLQGPPGDPGSMFFKVAAVDVPMSPTIVLDTAQGNVFRINLSADATIAPPINAIDGQRATLEITANGHTVTWGNGWNFGLAGPPTLSTGGLTDIISSLYRASTGQWRAGYTQGF
jgi:hypothetical protein